jgi:hypothetical protein
VTGTPVLPRRFWTDAEEDRLRRLAPRLSSHKVARLLGRTPYAVESRARMLRIVRQKCGEVHQTAAYSDDTVREILRRFFREGQSATAISAAMGVPCGTIYNFTNGHRRPHIRHEFVGG